MSMFTAKIHSLHIYPVKSCHRIDLKHAVLTECGLAWDRTWVIVGADGHFISQRNPKAYKLAQVVPELLGDALLLHAPGKEPLPVEMQSPPRRAARAYYMHDKENALHGLDEGDHAAKWLSEFLQLPVRLLRVDHEFRRTLPPLYAGSSRAHSAGQDGFPYLVTSVESLEDLNRRLLSAGAPEIPMTRFRPNIVISGLGPWGEDRFSDLKLPDREIHIRHVKPCGRCPMIEIDQESGVLAATKRDHTVNRNLNFRLLRNKEGKEHKMFGQNAVVESGFGRAVKIGDIFHAFEGDTGFAPSA